MGFIEKTYNSTVEFLDTIGEAQYVAMASELASTAQILAAIVVILVLINMASQYYPIDMGSSIMLIVKIALVALFLQNWAQFNSLTNAIYALFDGVAGSLLSAVSGEATEGSFAKSLDDLIKDFSAFANVTAGKLNILGSVINGVMIVFVSIFGAICTLVMITARVVLAMLFALGPLAIVATLANSTRSYFESWLSAVVTMMLFPIVIAGMFATIVAMGKETIRGFSSDDVVKIGDVAPIMMLLALSIILVMLSPFIVTLITGQIQLGQITGRAGGAMAGKASSGTRAAVTGGTNIVMGSRPREEMPARSGGLVQAAKDTSSYASTSSLGPTRLPNDPMKGEQLRRQSERVKRFQK